MRLLEAHHSRPIYQMGKQGWGGKWGSQDQWGYGASQSWSSWKGQNKAGQQNGKAEPVHAMSYKDVQLSLSSQANAAKEEVEDKEGTETRRTAQVVQKAVNLARKADVRHKKSVEELAQCKRLWGEYQRQMREAYSKEFAQHKADVEKYELEVKKNKEASEMAAVRMRQVLLDGEENQLAEPVAMECVGEDPDPWEDLLQGTAAEEETADKEVADYLQNMLRTAQETRQAAKLRLQDLAQGRPTCRPAAPKATPTRSLTGEGPPYYGPSPNPRRTLVEDPYGTTTPARGGPPAGRAAPVEDALLPVTPNKQLKTHGARAPTTSREPWHKAPEGQVGLKPSGAHGQGSHGCVDLDPDEDEELPLNALGGME